MTGFIRIFRSSRTGEAESAYAWLRLFASLGIGTVGSVGLWSYVVALPAVQAEFSLVRADASLPYTATMLGFGIGAILLGGISDRFSIVAATVGGAILIGIGYLISGFAPSLHVLAFASVILGLGSSASFAPLMADISHWFTRRRGVCRYDCRLRKLSFRHALAAVYSALHCDKRLAADVFCDGCRLLSRHAAAFDDAPAQDLAAR